jgi:hypothetical protein
MYTVYIALAPGEDTDLIVEAASAIVLPGYDFSIREHSDPSEASDGELSFRVGGVAMPEEALRRALQIYAAAREAAGLRSDDTAEPSLVPTPRSG